MWNYLSALTELLLWTATGSTAARSSRRRRHAVAGVRRARNGLQIGLRKLSPASVKQVSQNKPKRIRRLLRSLAEVACDDEQNWAFKRQRNTGQAKSIHHPRNLRVLFLSPAFSQVCIIAMSKSHLLKEKGSHSKNGQASKQV
jgi:hypothetical protein